MLQYILAPQALIMLIMSLLGLVAAVWVYLDATEHAQYPFLCAALVFFVWPLFLPLYIMFRIYTSRGMSRSQQQQLNQDRIDPVRYRFPSEIERAKYLEQMTQGPGTMYSPLLGENVSAAGFAHFTVERAEVLLHERRYEEAWEYLTELYSVGLNDNDPRATDTYRHYILQIPGIQPRFKQWLDEHERPQDAPAPKTKREVPF